MNVLVVDDQSAMRMVSAAIISNMGHEVVQADNGSTAVEICETSKVDLILLDVEMPGMNGFETAQMIREKNPEWFPIIFLSARTDVEYFVKGIKSGGDIYLHKPIVPEVLESMVKAMERIASVQLELHHARIQMEQIAHKDALTGLVNRRGFDNAIELEMARAKKDHTSPTLILLDIDFFKPYNDNYGHQRGDECLKMVADILQQALCREFDIAARYGGEEFALLLPSNHKNIGEVVAKRLVELFNENKLSHEYSKIADFITVSGGGVEATPELNAQELIAAADKLLYKAKELGRNRILF